MGSQVNQPFALSIQANEHGKLLDVVDQLRSHGTSHYISLPQVIVCGDQSSGKSSVLGAISGIPFSIKDNLCTRFATEVILRRDLTHKIAISIIPGSNRSDEEKEKLENFQAPSLKANEFPSLIDAAKEVMGLGIGAKTFSDDVLRVEMSGPDQPHLTLVDLPGLIHSENKDQSASDVQLVSTLVKSYMANRRSIILAVVSAGNDYANQIVIRLARDVDPKGDRTLGVITKPDKLDVGSESESAFFNLAGNKNVTFRLGWHVLRNRNYEERDHSLEEREQIERNFFQNGLWTSLPAKILGISALKTRLSVLLKDQITTELPSLIQDVVTSIDDARGTLARLGEARGTLQEQRLYLVRVSQNFSSLVNAATNGAYGHEFFGEVMNSIGFSKRIRAVIQDILLEFAEKMCKEGHYYDIVNDLHEKVATEFPKQISRSDYLNHVREIMRRTRGCELPGLFNPLIVGDLFHEQSSPWQRLLENYKNKIVKAVRAFLERVLEYTTDEHTSEALLREVINPAMELCSDSLKVKVLEILRPYQSGHAIIYNHYFIEIMRKAQREHNMKYQAQQAIKFFRLKPSIDPSYIARPEPFSINDLLNALNDSETPGMEQHSCTEALEDMKAFYKVAMKVIVDNFSTLAIERCLVDSIKDMFSPNTVMRLSDSMIADIAAETEDSRDERTRTTKKLKSLETGLQILTRYSRDKPDDHLEENFNFSQTNNAAEDELGKLKSGETASEQHADNGDDTSAHLGPLHNSTANLSPFKKDGSLREDDDLLNSSVKLKRTRRSIGHLNTGAVFS